MKFCITGLNHRTAPVSVREQLAFDEQLLPNALQDLTHQPGLQEGLILSTCNRVEIAIAADDNITNARAAVEQFIADTKRVETRWVGPYLYHYEGPEAVRHLFRVAASLDSMVIGEPQILGQLKSAYAAAKSVGSIRGYLDTVLTRAFSVAKRVRSETEIGQSAVSISYAAVELAREIFGSLNNRRVLLVGAGKMSELAARHLRRSGASQVFVTNRTRQRADEMAAMFQGQVIDYQQLFTRLPEMDIVITSSGAPHYILQKEDMRRVIDARKNRPMFVIDIAVPRNVEPTVNQLDNVFLYDLDDLQKVVDTNLRGRQAEAAQADLIITEEVERLEHHLRTRQVAPTIVSLQEQLEQVRQAELQRARSRLGTLTPQQEAAIEALTKGIVNKVAHGAISELRTQATQPEGSAITEAIRRMFRLGQ